MTCLERDLPDRRKRVIAKIPASNNPKAAGSATSALAMVTLSTATVALAVSAVAVQMIIWLGRIRSPGIQRVAWTAVLVQGVVLAHFTVAIPWGDSEPLPVEAGPASDEARDQGLLSLPRPGGPP